MIAIALALSIVAGHEGTERFAPMMQPGTASVRTIDKGATSNSDAARQAVARTDAEWNALWKSHDDNRPAPKVDFSKEMVVAVFLGSRPTAGYGVEIVGADVRDGALVVRYRETKPAAGTMTAQILTSPYHMAAVRQYAGDVRFEKD